MTHPLDDQDDRDEAVPAGVQDALETAAGRRAGDPPFAVLRAAGADALPPELQQPAAAALAANPWAQSAVRGADSAVSVEDPLDPASVERLLARIHQSAAGEMPVTPLRATRTWHPSLLYPALGLAAAAVIGFSLLVIRRPAPSPSVQPDTPAPAAALSPAFHVPIEAPAVKLTSRALVLRSQGTSSAFVDQIAPAIDTYRAGRYHDAAAQFGALAPRYPGSIEIAFYRGVSQLLDGDAAAALASLTVADAVHDPVFADDVAWYLAAAEERAGHVAAARTRLAALCGGTSTYAARACDAAAKLPH